MWDNGSIQNYDCTLIDKVKVPVLFLYGEKDIFSRPDKSKLLIEKCGSEIKEVEWFKEGAHSHLRYTNPEQYDAAILRFSKKDIFAETWRKRLKS